MTEYRAEDERVRQEVADKILGKIEAGYDKTVTVREKSRPPVKSGVTKKDDDYKYLFEQSLRAAEGDAKVLNSIAYQNKTVEIDGIKHTIRSAERIKDPKTGEEVIAFLDKNKATIQSFSMKIKPEERGLLIASFISGEKYYKLKKYWQESKEDAKGQYQVGEVKELVKFNKKDTFNFAKLTKQIEAASGDEEEVYELLNNLQGLINDGFTFEESGFRDNITIQGSADLKAPKKTFNLEDKGAYKQLLAYIDTYRGFKY